MRTKGRLVVIALAAGVLSLPVEGSLARVCSGPAVPFEITAGPDGNVWFTEIAANKIAAMDMAGHIVKEVAIPTAASGPAGIAPGRMNDVWFTESAAGKVARYDIATGRLFEYPVPGGRFRLPRTLTLGPDGNMWFTYDLIGAVGRVTYDGEFTEFAIPLSGRTVGITTGPDGAVWFADNGGNAVGRISVSGELTQFLVGSHTPRGIVSGRGDDLWFTDSEIPFDNSIGRISTSGEVTLFPLPTPSSFPDNITPDDEGNFWFTETTGMKIGRVTPTGEITEFDIPTQVSAPIGITTGVDAAMWFTEAAADKIGRVSTSGTFSEFPVSGCARYR